MGICITKEWMSAVGRGVSGTLGEGGYILINYRILEEEKKGKRKDRNINRKATVERSGDNNRKERNILYKYQWFLK